MQNEDSSVTIAKINFRQAISVAVIAGLVGIVTTLISTGHLFPRAAVGTSGDQREIEARSTVLEAPHLAFSTKSIDLSLEQCMANAREALEKSEYSGLEFGRYFSWAYNGTTTGLIWCHTDEDLVIYIGAGKDWQSTQGTSEELRRLFRPSR